MLSTTVNLPKSTQNYPKLPKSAQKQLAWGTLKYHQNFGFRFFKIKIKFVRKRGDIKAFAYHLDFQYKIVLHVYFIVKKLPLYVNFSISPCGKSFSSWCSTPLVGMRFFLYVPNSPMNKIMKRPIPYLLKNIVFFASKTLLSSFGLGIKTFSLT
jgi:hypothetical protein